MVNATLNATLNATQSVDVGTATALFFTVVIPEIFSRFFAFIAAPFIYGDMWWLLIHLILTFVLFELYFERHGEDLGWTAALANSIVMIFISMELLRAIYGHMGSPIAVATQVVRDYFTAGASDQMVLVTLILLLGASGIATAIINYLHLLPRQIAFLISGHNTVNLLAYFLIVVVWRFTHGDPMPLDAITLVGIAMFGALMWLIIFALTHARSQAHAQKHRTGVFR